MHNISSIQQVGLGASNVKEVYRWYKKHFAMDVKVFSERAEAALMTKYTGGKVHKRHAILALNKNGGGGIEFWQFTSREPISYSGKVLPGDIGITKVKMKVSNIQEAYANVAKLGVHIYYEIGDNVMDPASFAFHDPFGNDVQLIESVNWYNQDRAAKQGGVLGAVIGVSDLDKSVQFYKEVLGFDVVRDLLENDYGDLDAIAGEKYQYRRVVLKHTKPRRGPFAKLLGSNEIELIQVLDRVPAKLFEGRFWGDQGYIHLCFDVQNMGVLKQVCEQYGSPFTVDSADSFDMGKAAGRFAYLEDPDGTLIEFVETHKIPIVPWIGWYYKLPKNELAEAPEWLMKLMFLTAK